MNDPSSVPVTVIPSSGRNARRLPEPTNVAATALVVTEPTTTRALTAPADTHGGTMTLNDVSASPRTTRPFADPKNAVFPAAATLKNLPRNRTVSPAENDVGITLSSRG